MTLYIATFIALLIAAVAEFISNRTPKVLYAILFVWLTIVLCCRYGIGSDYFSYYYIYLNCEWKGFFKSFVPGYIHGEWGWLLICAICHTAGMRFELFIAAVGFINMLLLNRFIKVNCDRKILALLIAYPTLYLTYYFSALRQGLTISIFLAFILPELLEKNKVKYIIGVVALSLIHSSILVALLVLFLDVIELSIDRIIKYSIAAIVFGIIIIITPVHNYVPYADSGISIIAIAERMISLMIVLIAASEYYNKEGYEKLTKMINIYSLGAMMYFALMTSSLTASRLTAVFKVLEIGIYACIIKYDLRKTATVVFAFLLMLTSVTFFKNIDAYITQCGFPEETTVWEFRYYSVFDRKALLRMKKNDMYVDYLYSHHRELLP